MGRVAAANRGSALADGEDIWTQHAADAFRDLFEPRCEVFFAFNGTAANSLALASLWQSYHSVICSSAAHVETDERGAPEFFSNGSKLLVARTAGGKLAPDAIRAVRGCATRLAERIAGLPGVAPILPFEASAVFMRAPADALDRLRAMDWRFYTSIGARASRSRGTPIRHG